jgi:hypothetical protein
MVLVLPACGEDSTEPPPAPEAGESAFDRQVRENCEAVYATALAYYTDNGAYTTDGRHLLPYLPDGERLVNPATGVATEPISPRRFPMPAGATGYRAMWDMTPDWDVQQIGFVVVGRGEHCDMVLSNIDSIDVCLAKEEAVVENCRIVAAAVDAFTLENDGRYPSGDNEVNNAGLTVMDYMPEGRLLANPYYGWRTEPQWGVAAGYTGQTGYTPIDPNGDGVMDGYGIDGIGGDGVTVIYYLSCPPHAPDPWSTPLDWPLYRCE